MTIDERIEKLVESQEKTQILLADIVDGIRRLERTRGKTLTAEGGEEGQGGEVMEVTDGRSADGGLFVGASDADAAHC